MKSGKVSLTAMGICSALGSGLHEHKRAFNEASSSCMSEDSTVIPGQSCFLGKVNDSLLATIDMDRWYHPRFYRIVSLALEQILPDIERIKQRVPASRIGVVLGSSTSGIHAGEEAYLQREGAEGFPEWYQYRQQEMGSVSDFVSGFCGLHGPSYTISTACTSGGKALLAARRLLQVGLCDAVITGGVDSLCRLTIRGFHALGLIASHKSNPMSKNRDGLNLGEGACLFTMERGEEGVVLLGGGESSDAYHMSAPHPEGSGAIAAIEACMRDAQCSRDAIAYVNLHGTGTIHNDKAESIAVIKTLGSDVPCSSTKPMVGHLLGAAGAFEAGVAYCLLEQSSGIDMTLPYHLWDEEVDSELPEIRLVQRGEHLQKGAVLSTSFAFGGSNCALLFERGHG